MDRADWLERGWSSHLECGDLSPLFFRRTSADWNVPGRETEGQDPKTDKSPHLPVYAPDFPSRSAWASSKRHEIHRLELPQAALRPSVSPNAWQRRSGTFCPAISTGTGCQLWLFISWPACCGRPSRPAPSASRPSRGARWRRTARSSSPSRRSCRPRRGCRCT